MKNTPKRLNRPSKWKTRIISHPNYCHHLVGLLISWPSSRDGPRVAKCESALGDRSIIHEKSIKNREKIFVQNIVKSRLYRNLPFPRAFRVQSAIPHITQPFLTQKCLLRREPIDFKSLLIVFTALRTFFDFSERRTTEVSGKISPNQKYMLCDIWRLSLIFSSTKLR